MDRLRVVKTSQAILLVQATLLFTLTASGHMNIGLLVALAAFQGVVVAFNQPARLALVPSLVAPTDLASAVAINSVVFNLARFVGPMFAGLAIVWSRVRGVRGQCPELRRLPGGAGAHPRRTNQPSLPSTSAASPPICGKVSAIRQSIPRSPRFWSS